jgi:hypothetical protein
LLTFLRLRRGLPFDQITSAVAILPCQDVERDDGKRRPAPTEKESCFGEEFTQPLQGAERECGTLLGEGAWPPIASHSAVRPLPFFQGLNLVGELVDLSRQAGERADHLLDAGVGLRKRLKHAIELELLGLELLVLLLDFAFVLIL